MDGKNVSTLYLRPRRLRAVDVTVLEVSGSSVRLGIDAPSDVPVYRHEIWLAIKEENAAAALAPVSSVPTVIPPN